MCHHNSHSCSSGIYPGSLYFRQLCIYYITNPPLTFAVVAVVQCQGLDFFHVCFDELAMWPRFTYFSQCIWLSLPNIVIIGINYLAGLPPMFFFVFLGFHQAYCFISFNIVLVNSKNKCIIMKGVTSMCSQLTSQFFLLRSYLEGLSSDFTFQNSSSEISTT